MKELYSAILAPLITQAAAERNQSVADSKEIKFTSFSDSNLYRLERLK
ncbi:hypothetical protein [uncultured Campylobacter sp.]|nr:hypothetical protein [uncultured Campylobacter sp.]